MAKRDKGLSDKALYNRNFIQALRGAVLRGELTLAEAKVKAKPVMDEMNKRAKELAKEYGVPFKPISFTALMR